MGRCAFFPGAETLSKEAAGQLREEAAGAGANGRCALFSCAETVSNEAAGQLREGAAGAGAKGRCAFFPRAEILAREAAGQLHEGGVRFSLVLRLWPRKQRGSCARGQQGLELAVCVFPLR